VPSIPSEIVWRHKPSEYFKDCLRIEDKATAETIPLELKWHQVKIQEAIDRQRRARRPIRIQILKPRQTYVSTTSCANIFHAARFGRGISMIVSMDGDSSEHLFSMQQRFYNYLPESETAQLKTVASNRKELKFAPPHDGRIISETAGKTSAGHSFTIRNLLLSEVPRWPEGCTDAVIGLLNAVPFVPDTMIILEGVANGEQGWFYEEWFKPDSVYEKLFLSFKDHGEYVMPLPIVAEKYAVRLTEEERKLVAKYELSLEQIEFRRWATVNKCKGDPALFREQYPLSAAEAFRSSGNAFFSPTAVDNINPTDSIRGNLVEVEDNVGVRQPTYVPNPNGLLRLWRKPQSRREYVIGVDIAEGIELDGAPAHDKHDNSSFDVLDRNTGEQVCKLLGKVTPDELGRILALVGKWYNHSFIGPESNAGYGLHVIDTLRNANYPEHLIYKQQVMDETTKRPTTKVGWRTTKANRKTLMSNLDMALRQGDVIVNSDETKREIRSFVVKSDGRIEHGAGHHDDSVFSLAIANEMLEAAPPLQHKSPVPASGALSASRPNHRRLTDSGGMSVYSN
jgi:hypothetical protein